MNEQLDKLEAQLSELGEKILKGLDEFIDTVNETNRIWDKIIKQLNDTRSTEEKLN